MDRFLIADVVMKADYPVECWFLFDPPLHPGQSVLLSVPSYLAESVLNTPDNDVFAGNMVPGAPMDDAPVQVSSKCA